MKYEQLLLPFNQQDEAFEAAKTRGEAHTGLVTEYHHLQGLPNPFIAHEMATERTQHARAVLGSRALIVTRMIDTETETEPTLGNGISDLQRRAFVRALHARASTSADESDEGLSLEKLEVKYLDVDPPSYENRQLWNPPVPSHPPKKLTKDQQEANGRAHWIRAQKLRRGK